MYPLIGSDPEVFVYEQDGTIGSAIGRIGGSKDSPIPVEGGALQEDNVLAEFNTNPASSEDEFVSNHLLVMDQLVDVVGPLAIQSSYEYEKRILKSFGRKALEFGCDPDFNAWMQSFNRPPSPFTTLRSAGGHLHFGYDGVDEETNTTLIKLADLFISVPGVVITPNCKRRSLYGKAGCMRHKEYGVEYRTPSNFWLQSEELMRWAYRACIKAWDSLPDASNLIASAGGSEFVQYVINENKVGEARAICNNIGADYV